MLSLLTHAYTWRIENSKNNYIKNVTLSSLGNCPKTTESYNATFSLNSYANVGNDLIFPNFFEVYISTCYKPLLLTIVNNQKTSEEPRF